jgi:hypothetical protein
VRPVRFDRDPQCGEKSAESESLQSHLDRGRVRPAVDHRPITIDHHLQVTDQISGMGDGLE